jgi:AcrR family transcriptional regulator
MPTKKPGDKRQSRGSVRYETDGRNCAGKITTMKSEKQDRRSQRTQRALGEALVSFMMERRYADLTVQDILDRANVGRSTFYAHYYDKDDLLSSMIEQLIAALNRRLQTTETRLELPPSLGLFEHMGEQRRLYRALVRGQGVDVVLRALQQRLSDDFAAQLRAWQPVLAEKIIIVTAQGVVGMLLSLLQWWLANETDLSPTEMDAYFRQLVMPGVQALLQSPLS